MRVALGVFFCAVAFGADASDLYAAVNRLRAGDGACAAKKLPPLQPKAKLERVARELARGGRLEESLKAAGYRAMRSHALSVRGYGVSEKAPAILAKPEYCPRLQHAEMTDIGIHLDSRQLWVVMAAPFTPSVGMPEQAALQRVLELVNRARAAPRACGGKSFGAAPPVRWNDTLAEASRRHAADMARHNYFSHRGRDGSDPGQRIERAGYRYRATGENIAAGGRMTPDDAVAGWVRSPAHCANLMSPAFTEMGAAFAIDAASEMGVYWAQAFGRPR
jgi:uncharacterized protein YkwD